MPKEQDELLAALAGLKSAVLAEAASVTSQEVSVADAALSLRVDTLSQAISVLSQQISALSSNLLDARMDTMSQHVNNLSQKVSGLSQAVSVLSQAVSVLASQRGIITQVMPVSTLTHITSLDISAVAGGIYEVHIAGLFSPLEMGQPFIIGVSCLGGFVRMGGKSRVALSVVTGGRALVSATITGGGYFAGISPLSTAFILSATLGATAGIRPFWVDGLFVTSTTGPITFNMGTSAGQSFFILPGTYMQAYKVG